MVSKLLSHCHMYSTSSPFVIRFPRPYNYVCVCVCVCVWVWVWVCVYVNACQSLLCRYAHYDGSPSFGDFEPFGGWNKPAIKQYAADASVCGKELVVNYMMIVIIIVGNILIMT